MIGFECKWGCPSCGNILNSFSVLSGYTIKLDQPNKCGCGRKGRFKFLLLKQIELIKHEKKQEEILDDSVKKWNISKSKSKKGVAMG